MEQKRQAEFIGHEDRLLAPALGKLRLVQSALKRSSESPLTTEREKVLSAHAWTAAKVAEALGTGFDRGLSGQEASQRLAADGPNALKEEKQVTLWEVIARQFASFLIVILIVAGAVSFALGEIVDATLILTIVVLNAALGAIQELRAEKALEALMHAVAPMARVIRGGAMREIPADELVQGDLVVLQAGDLVPADMRIVADQEAIGWEVIFRTTPNPSP